MRTTDDSVAVGVQHGTAPKFTQLNLSVLIVGNCFRAGAVEMFARAGCRGAEDIDDADLVVFLGGEDVDPDLYGEARHATTYANRVRDDREKAIFDAAVALGIPMFGICRGMQLIHVLRGGKLYQNVRGHAGTPHPIVSDGGRRLCIATSMHHQMCIVDEMTTPVAWAEKLGQGSPYETATSIIESDASRDLEAAIYYDVGAFAVQGHPEVGGYPAYTEWCLSMLSRFLVEIDVMNRRVSDLEDIARSLRA